MLATLFGAVGALLVLLRPAPGSGPSTGRAANAPAAGVLADLSSVDDATRLGDGWVLVDGRERALHITDSLGNVLRQIGRRGQGPGEFQYPRLVAATDDHIFVAQLSRPDLSQFDHSGRFVRQISAANACGAGSIELLAASVTDVVALRRCLEPPHRIRLQLERLVDGELRPWGTTDTLPFLPGGVIEISFPLLAVHGQRVLLGDGGSGCLRAVDLATGVVSARSCLDWLPRMATPDSMRERLNARGRGRVVFPDSLPRLWRLVPHGDNLAAMVSEDLTSYRWRVLFSDATPPTSVPLGQVAADLSYLSQYTQLIVTDGDDGIRLETIRVQR